MELAVVIVLFILMTLSLVIPAMRNRAVRRKRREYYSKYREALDNKEHSKAKLLLRKAIQDDLEP